MANKKTAPLTDTEIKNAKPKEKNYTKPDGNGLQLVIKTNGTKIWEIRFTLNGNPRKTTYGQYPHVSLADARKRRDEIKKSILNGVDPIKEAKDNKTQALEDLKLDKMEEERLANTFEKVTRDYFVRIEGYGDYTYHTKKLARLKNHVFSYIGEVPINELTRKNITDIIDRLVSQKKLDTAKRILEIIGQVFRYAVLREITPHNIIADIDKKLVIGKIESKHYATLTKPQDIGILLRAIDDYHGSIIVKYALQLAILTSQRPYNIRFAEWSEFDLVKNQWIISAEKMKMKRAHIVPLTDQILSILNELAPFTKNSSKYLFPALSTNMKPISENTLNTALRRLGYSKDEIVSHGFRAMFSTIANENIPIHGCHTDVIERHLAHVELNKVKGAYNHAEYIDQRVSLIKWWNDYLERLKNDEKIA
jgi:integrase